MSIRRTAFLLALLATFAVPAGADEGVTVALVGGEVRTADGPAIAKGTVLIRDGRIVAVGADVDVPAGAERIDCRGKVVTPGLIDADAALGLAGADRSGSRVAADQRASDAVDRWDERIRTARSQGVTAWFAGANATDTIGGLASAFTSGTVTAEPLSVDNAVVLNLSQAGASGGMWGAARLAAVRGVLVGARNLQVQLERWRRELREFEEARSAAGPTAEEDLLLPPEVLEAMEQWTPKQRDEWRAAVYKSMDRAKDYEKPKRLPEPPRAPRANDASRVLQTLFEGGGKVRRRAFMRAELGPDVAAALDLAHEFSLDVVLAGGAGLLEHADALREAKIPVVVTNVADTSHKERGPLARRPTDLVARAAAAGLKPALGSGNGSGGARYLRLLAAAEIGHGLSDDDALRAVTLWAASCAGVDDVTGSLTAGKRADLVVWSGDPFSATTRAEHVFVAGERPVSGD